MKTTTLTKHNGKTYSFEVVHKLGSIFYGFRHEIKVGD